MTKLSKGALLGAAAAISMVAGTASAATVFGTPDAGSTGAPNAAEEANLLAGAAVLGLEADSSDISGFFIPFQGTLDTTFSFTGYGGGAPTYLQFVFEDLDLGPINDPDFFFEAVSVQGPNGLGPIAISNVGDGGSFVVPGTEGDDAVVAFEFDLGFLDAGDYEAVLTFSSEGASGGGNTEEYVIAALSGESINVVPLPAAGWMLIAGLGGLGLMRRRKKAV